MSKPFRRIYPEKGRVLFDGGKNSKFEKTIILDNESPDCANVVFENGAVGTRQGSGKLNTTAAGSFACDGLFTRRAQDGTETMCAFFGGLMRTWGGSTFATVPSAQSVFTAGVNVFAAQSENYIFFGNGSQIPYKWNGAEFTRHGVYPPTSTSTVASQATGVLTGDYRYKITNVNSNLVESDVGPVTATFTAASATIRISSIPTYAASYGVNARRVYRTVAGGSTFKRVATISDNTSTTYDDSTADAGLGADAPTDNGVPPTYSAIVYHAGRLFVLDPTEPNQVKWSNVGDPYTFASTNFQTVGDNTSDLAKALAVYDNSLIVFCERSITIGYMPSTDDSEWKWITSRSPFGSKSPRCILTYNNKLLFPAVEGGKFVGFAKFAGDTVEPSASLLTVSTAGSETVSDRIQPDMFEVQEGYLQNIAGIVYKKKAYIALTYGSGQTTNNRYYTFDFSGSNLSKNQQESWVPNTGLTPACFTVYDGKLYFGTSAATGFVYELENGTYNDSGAAIDSYFWTKELSGFSNEVNFHKDFRFVNLLVDSAGDYNMTLGYRVDSDSGDGDVQNINLDPGGSLWGAMIWGTDSWGGGTDQAEMEVSLGGVRGKRIQFKFSNGNAADQRFKVHGLNYSYNRKGFR